MKFRVTMKDPDVLHNGINEALDGWFLASGLPKDEQDAIREISHEKASDVASQWFEYGEYLTVEIDTEEETIKVIRSEV